MKYRVRKGFVLHRPDRPPVQGGTIVDLSAAEFEQYAHQLEPYEVIPLTEPKTEPEAIVPTDSDSEPTETPKRRSRKKNPEKEAEPQIPTELLDEELTDATT
jgi:hypothetical protein